MVGEGGQQREKAKGPTPATEAAVAAQAQQDLAWRILGLEVARKTEILALAAFVLSFTAAAWQVKNYLAGPVIRLFSSDQVTLTSASKLARIYEGEPNLVRVIATMSYVNQGEKDQNGIVRKETIDLTIGSRTVEHRWYQFVSSDLKDGKIELNRKSESRPFPVVAGNAESHETLFAPWVQSCEPDATRCSPDQNFLRWDDLLQVLETTKTIKIVTRAEIYTKSPVFAECTISLKNEELEVLKKDQWLAAACEARERVPRNSNAVAVR